MTQPENQSSTSIKLPQTSETNLVPADRILRTALIVLDQPGIKTLQEALYYANLIALRHPSN